MPRQLITVRKTGAVFGLDHKRKGLDLATLGKAKKRRASEIVWNIDEQKWMVNLLRKENGEVVTLGTLLLAGVIVPNCTVVGEVLLFGDYEDAVTAEVAILQGLQTKGLI